MSENLADFLFRPNETELSYSLTGKFENVELVHWLGNQELPYTINGEISAVGREPTPLLPVKYYRPTEQLAVQDEQPDKLLFDFSLNNGNLTGQLQGKGKFGSFILEPSVQNLLNLPVYSAKLTTQNLDLQRLTGIESLNSNLNMTAQVKGREFDPGKITVAGQIIVLNSSFSISNLTHFIPRRNTATKIFCSILCGQKPKQYC
jgi:translocation and assembly module TamB